mmetsp:Transcript_144454/g.448490  ORF Transcript_144454/g.448490 Transcript_144454/m.448490 type:complete len:260 (-) Transcript_144454:115-894(-)
MLRPLAPVLVVPNIDGTEVSLGQARRLQQKCRHRVQTPHVSNDVEVAQQLKRQIRRLPVDGPNGPVLRHGTVVVDQVAHHVVIQVPGERPCRAAVHCPRRRGLGEHVQVPLVVVVGAGHAVQGFTQHREGRVVAALRVRHGPPPQHERGALQQPRGHVVLRHVQHHVRRHGGDPLLQAAGFSREVEAGRARRAVHLEELDLAACCARLPPRVIHGGAAGLRDVIEVHHMACRARPDQQHQACCCHQLLQHEGMAQPASN